MTTITARDLDAPERLRCDLPRCRRTTRATEDRFDRGWEVWGTTMDVFDFCSERHYLTFHAAHPEWHNQ